MKRAGFTLLLLLFFPIIANARETDLSQALAHMDLSGWDAAAGDTLMDTTANQLVAELAAQQASLDAVDLLAQLGGMIRRALYRQKAQLASLCALVCVAALAARLHSQLGGRIGQLTRLACAALCMSVPLALVRDAMDASFFAAQHLARFSSAALPAVSALGAALGAAGSAAMLSPMTASAASLASMLTCQIGRPLLCALSALAVVEPISGDLGIGRIFDSVRQLAGFALTAALTVFACAALVQGTQTAHADSAALRGAKYAIDNYVPVVGGLFADTFELLTSSALMLKNAVGLAAMLYVGVLALEPLLGLAASFLVLKAGALFAHLTGERASGDMLDRFAQILAMAAALTATCAALYLTVMAAACACTDAAVMLR